MTELEAIVLAGGFGTRLRSVVSDVPKPMAPVAGVPFLSIVLRLLATRGFSRVILSVGYMADAIAETFGASFEGVDLVYCRETSPLGTGGAMKESFSLARSDHVHVLNGDTLLEVDVPLLEDQWRRFRRPLLVGRLVPDTTRYGRVSDIDGRITAFGVAGSGPGVINGGYYVLDRHFLDDCALQAPFSFERDVLPAAILQRELRLVVSEGYFIDIGVPEDYARAQVELPARFGVNSSSRSPVHT